METNQLICNSKDFNDFYMRLCLIENKFLKTLDIQAITEFRSDINFIR